MERGSFHHTRSLVVREPLLQRGEEDHDTVPSGGRRARWHGSQYIAWEWVGRSLEQFPTHPAARLGESFGLSPDQGTLVLEQ